MEGLGEGKQSRTIASDLGALESLLDNILGGLDKLEARLAPVLRPPDPCTEKDCGSGGGLNSPLGQKAISLQHQASSAGEKIADFMARLEI